jgi:hypothetical protein
VEHFEEKMSRPGLHHPEDKLLLVLQYWKGDRDQAMALARFIADLQPFKCANADFLFVARFDCPHDMDAINYVSKKFNVSHYVSKRRGTGWPNGCNDLWFGAMEWVQSMMAERRIPAYKAIFTFEADGVPLSPNWINQFSADWDAEAKKHETFVFGAQLEAPGPHINGNAMVSGHPAFLHWVVRKVGGAPPNAGWDYVLYRDFKKWGAWNYPKLRSYWGSKTFTRAGFANELSAGTVWLHGIKDNSLLEMARKKFLG